MIRLASTKPRKLALQTTKTHQSVPRGELLPPMRIKPRLRVGTGGADFARMGAWLRMALRHWPLPVAKPSFGPLTLDIETVALRIRQPAGDWIFDDLYVVVVFKFSPTNTKPVALWLSDFRRRLIDLTVEAMFCHILREKTNATKILTLYGGKTIDRW